MAATDVPRSPVDDYVAFQPSGARGVGEFLCSECGHAIVSRGVLPICPMCRGSRWEHAPWRPFTRRETP